MNLEWDPNECGTFDSSIVDSTSVVAQGDTEFFAYGTFEVVADHDASQYFDYLQTKFASNQTEEEEEESFITILNQLINDNEFNALAVTISDAAPQYTPKETDDFQNVALDVTYGLYGFMGVCVLFAIVGKCHAYCR